MKKLKYIDHRPMSISLKLYGGRFISLPNKNFETINVTDDEARVLLKRKNGEKPTFELVNETRRRQAETE